MQRSTAIAAYLPQTEKDAGSISLKIGMVQIFFVTKLHWLKALQVQIKLKIFKIACNTFVKWYSDHSQHDHIHDSVVITGSVLDCKPCEYLLVTRIVGRTAVVKTMFKFDYGEDCVIISVPFLKKS